MQNRFFSLYLHQTDTQHTQIKLRIPTLDYQESRDREFCDTFYYTLNLCGGIMCDYIYQAAIQSPSKRFYIGNEKAITNLLNIKKGKRITSCPIKQKMYIDLYKKACEIQAGDDRISFSEAVRRAIRSPAPQFYISVRTARHIIAMRRKDAFFNQKRKEASNELL